MSIIDKSLFQRATWLPLRQAHRSVCHKHIDLFHPYVPQRNNQGSSLPTALAGITISLTDSQFAHLPFISIPLALFGLLCAENRKTNSFPYKWSESLQPRDPVELQIFHLCLGALRYYSSAIIPSLSCCLFSYFLSLSRSHMCSPPLCTRAYADPLRLHLVFQITPLIVKKSTFFQQHYSHSQVPLRSQR